MILNVSSLFLFKRIRLKLVGECLLALFCEGILACKRAGAQAVISYAAMDVARAISS